MKKLILILCLALAGCDSGKPKLKQAETTNKDGVLEIVSEQEYSYATYRVIRNKETGEKFIVVRGSDCVAITPMK